MRRLKLAIGMTKIEILFYLLICQIKVGPLRTPAKPTHLK
jgi:hypothetical protein